jgi:hypothetical protein
MEQPQDPRMRASAWAHRSHRCRAGLSHASRCSSCRVFQRPSRASTRAPPERRLARARARTATPASGCGGRGPHPRSTRCRRCPPRSTPWWRPRSSSSPRAPALQHSARRAAAPARSPPRLAPPRSRLMLRRSTPGRPTRGCRLRRGGRPAPAAPARPPPSPPGMRSTAPPPHPPRTTRIQTTPPVGRQDGGRAARGSTLCCSTSCSSRWCSAYRRRGEALWARREPQRGRLRATQSQLHGTLPRGCLHGRRPLPRREQRRR